MAFSSLTLAKHTARRRAEALEHAAATPAPLTHGHLVVKGDRDPAVDPYACHVFREWSDAPPSPQGGRLALLTWSYNGTTSSAWEREIRPCPIGPDAVAAVISAHHAEQGRTVVPVVRFPAPVLDAPSRVRGDRGWNYYRGRVRCADADDRTPCQVASDCHACTACYVGMPHTEAFHAACVARAARERGSAPVRTLVASAVLVGVLGTVGAFLSGPRPAVTPRPAPAELIYAEQVWHADAEDDCPTLPGLVSVDRDPAGGVVCRYWH